MHHRETKLSNAKFKQGHHPPKDHDVYDENKNYIIENYCESSFEEKCDQLETSYALINAQETNSKFKQQLLLYRERNDILVSEIDGINRRVQDVEETLLKAKQFEKEMRDDLKQTEKEISEIKKKVESFENQTKKQILPSPGLQAEYNELKRRTHVLEQIIEDKDKLIMTLKCQGCNVNPFKFLEEAKVLEENLMCHQSNFKEAKLRLTERKPRVESFQEQISAHIRNIAILNQSIISLLGSSGYRKLAEKSAQLSEHPSKQL